MEAHKLLKEAGLNVCVLTRFTADVLPKPGIRIAEAPDSNTRQMQVQSFGVNTCVKLPGESADSPNQYGEQDLGCRCVQEHRRGMQLPI